jgi:YD repeat-containing protein
MIFDGNVTSGGGKFYSWDYRNRITVAGNGTTSLGYDNDGNLTSSGTTTCTYDYANRLIALYAGGATTTYGYDAFGQRVLQIGTSTTTIYPFKWYSIASSTGSGAKSPDVTGKAYSFRYEWN